MSSRESDNAYPTPRRTGPDAYPSGTPPYGTPGIPDDAQSDPGAAPAEGDDVPKTETTLTTRVRINIPGSRPIPPVVVRSAVKNEEPAAERPAAAEPPGPRHRSAAPSSPVLGVMDGSARTATPPNLPPEWQTGEPGGQSEAESTGEWFRPRQRKGADPAPSPVPAGAPSTPSARPSANRSAEARPAAARAEPNRQNGPRPTPGPRPTGAPASPFGAPVEPEGPAASAAFDDGLPAGPFANDPFAADPFAAEALGPDAGASLPSRPRPQNGAPHNGAARNGGRPGAGPVRPEDTEIGGFEPIRDEGPATAAIPGLARTAPFAAQPGQGADPFAAQQPGQGADPFAPQRTGGQQDPFSPAAAGGRFPGSPGQGADPFAAQQPGAGTDPFAPGDPFATGPARPKTGSPAEPPAPAAPSAAEPASEPPAPRAAAPKRRGRGAKLAVYGAVLLLFAGAAAYGTGLMLNQSDIPKGTVVLGTGIGGSSRDQAIHQLDDTVGKAGQQPVKLKIGDQAVALDPTAAGLSFDTTGTVDDLTRHSYNPVDVITSLKGGDKAVPPQVKVDRAKLRAALDALATGSGQGLQEGYVKFTENGDIVVVPGKAGQAVDSAAAVDLVEQAYRDRAAGKPESLVTLPVAAAQPKVSPQALQAAADSLGKSVLNGNVHVSAGVKKFEFGKATAAVALTLAPDATGKIVLKWDDQQLTAKLAGAFDKMKFRQNGALVPITVKDVEAGIASVLDGSGDKDRTFKFPLT
ncbi:peptidoglycan binding domain-containing protein [Kitasatospora sp. NBC_00315]|uniref:peptidoglycan binding domain-containing protein n=1 Tax=Kitasatospora sp. NBC_00315 TaxID=2975963 RepID=UPI003245FF3E